MMMEEIGFTVAGNPIPKARARVVIRDGGAHAYTPERTREWEGHVAVVARQAMQGARPWQGSVVLRLAFYRRDRHWVDLSNLEKAIEDALNGIVYRDDSQVVEKHSVKCVDRERPRVEVRVARVRTGKQ